MTTKKLKFTKNNFCHRIAIESVKEQQLYLIEIARCIKNTPEKYRESLVELLEKLNLLCGLKISTEDISLYSDSFLDRSAFNDLLYQDLFIIIVQNNSENNEDFSDIYKILKYNDEKKEIYQDVFPEYFDFIKMALNVEDIISFVYSATNFKFPSYAWEYILINRGFDIEECLGLKATTELGFDDICYAFRKNNFTTTLYNDFLAADFLFMNYNPIALDYIIKRGCNLHKEINGENIFSKVPFIEEEPLKYLLRHNVKIPKEELKAWLMFEETNNNIKIVIEHGISIPEDVFFVHYCLTEDILKYYLKNGGNPNAFSEEYDMSLIDFYVLNERPDLVKILEQHGALVTDDAIPFSKILDFFSNMDKN